MAYGYIPPQGTIYLLSGVPLDNTYDHTLYFESKTAQFNYFYSKFQFKFENQYYTRKGRGVLRIQKNAETLYHCNYLMFQNAGFLPQAAVTKWFYCFITDVEYVNNEVSDVYYEIDPMQTWFYGGANNADNDYTLEQCFVEREHSATDVIGENTVPEPVDVGEYSIYDTNTLYWLRPVEPPESGPTTPVPLMQGKYSAVIAAPWKVTDYVLGTDLYYRPVYRDAGSKFYGNQLSGLYYSVFDLTDIETDPLVTIPPVNPPQHDVTKLLTILNDDTSGGTKRLQEIVAIYIVPTCMVSTPTDNPQSSVKYTTADIVKPYAWSYKVNGTATSVKNNKLYTSPYNILHMVSSDGDFVDYAYERFNTPTTCKFSVEGVMGSPPQIQLVPFDYKTVSYDAQNPVRNYNESLLLENFGLCSWVTDTFRAWLAQNSSRMITKTITGVATAAAGFAYGGAVASAAGFASKKFMSHRLGMEASGEHTQQIAGIGLADNIMSSLSEIHAASLMPDATHGVSKNLIGASNGELGYRYYMFRIKDEYAVIVDDFFNRFGYATKRTKIPNINVRPKWCYTKTKGCNITGTIPTSAASQICRIYDNGITFWKDTANVGDYTQNNSPAT